MPAAKKATPAQAKTPAKPKAAPKKGPARKVAAKKVGAKNAPAPSASAASARPSLAETAQQTDPALPALTGIYVEGFKSFAPLSEAERKAAYKRFADLDKGKYPKPFGEPFESKGWYPVRPLTVLCGPNTNGKSSLTQSFLLLKQSWAERAWGRALVLSGGLLRFDYATELAPAIETIDMHLGCSFRADFPLSGDLPSPALAANIPSPAIVSTFRLVAENDLRVGQSRLGIFDDKRITVGSTNRFIPNYPLQRSTYDVEIDDPDQIALYWIAGEFHGPFWIGRNVGSLYTPGESAANSTTRDIRMNYLADAWKWASQQIVDGIEGALFIAGRREAGVRFYPVTTTSLAPGLRFDTQFASILALWHATGDERLEQVRAAMEELGLAKKLEAKVANANDVEIQVDAGLGNGHDRTVNISLVGLGVSAALPVVTALIHAQKNQTVIIEEPEMHLHPMGQLAMADVIFDAAKRGVRVIVETHSDLLLLHLQTRIAQESLKESPELKPGDAVFHWFEKDAESDGATRVMTVFPDAAGRVGKWPNNFAKFTVNAQREFIEAASKAAQRLRERP
jgi:hypothetical protein